MICYNYCSLNMLKEYRVKFLPIERSFPVEEGQTILEAAMMAGVHINASCGGNGACGKCKVKILEGNAASPVSPKISLDEYEAGTRLACQTTIHSDIVVEIPLESQIDKSILKRTIKDTHITSDFQKKGLLAKTPVKPLVSKLYMELPEPVPEDNISDFGRITREISVLMPGNTYVASLEIIKKLGRMLRESEWKITVTMVNSGGDCEIIHVEPGNRTADMYAIAIDIGTTTVCGRLIDVSAKGSGVRRGQESEEESVPGRVMAEAADYNSQISYGEDVISRIMYTRKKGGLKKLQGIVVKTINGIIEELLTAGGVRSDEISLMVFAGNTTMTHLLLGIDPTYIMLAPYIPATTSFPPVRARDLGITVEEHVPAYTLPCVASYIGGDIVGGVLASGMQAQEKVSLFMDIGTNGELVLGNNEWLLSASCSAGPSFEGGGIQFGMRASPGAIEQVRINPSTYEPMVFTVGKAKPSGICGSGLIDIVAGLLEAGLIDQRGKFKKDTGTNRVREGSDGYEYVLCFAPETAIDKDIVITEIDLDNLIRTKAAVYAGCKVLLDSAGLAFSDLDMVIIAGGFGRYIDVEKAKVIGLLPELPGDKFQFMGNGSLLGVHLVCLNSDVWLETQKVATMMTNVELSNNNNFMDEFMAAMFLPHTDQNLFPEVIERLKGV
ncbi:MAG: ferredoxin [Syntrophus sp. (in: bacteria)]|nr:ferredoxin [Syntrophus sp. (in: bacteria)]